MLLSPVPASLSLLSFLSVPFSQRVFLSASFSARLSERLFPSASSRCSATPSALLRPPFFPGPARPRASRAPRAASRADSSSLVRYQGSRASQFAHKLRAAFVCYNGLEQPLCATIDSSSLCVLPWISNNVERVESKGTQAPRKLTSACSLFPLVLVKQESPICRRHASAVLI